MLTKILMEFARQKRPLSSRELAGTFDKDPAVMEGMLETLMRSGSLVEMDPDGPCHQCSEQRLCLAVPLDGRRFCLASSDAGTLPLDKESGLNDDGGKAA